MRVLFAATASSHNGAVPDPIANFTEALPVALSRRGIEASVIMPATDGASLETSDSAVALRLDGNGSRGSAEILSSSKRDGVMRWFVRTRDGATSSPVDAAASFCETVATFVKSNAAPRPDIIHLQDWQTSLVPSLLRVRQSVRVPTLLTVHDAAMQGPASAEQLAAVGVSERELSTPRANGLSMLALGIANADRLTTVSPTHAAELTRGPRGRGLERAFSSRARELLGILNGDDYRAWDPSVDSHIKERYGRDDLSGKARCKEELEREMGLEDASFAPLLAVVSPLTTDKGLDLVVRIVDVLVTAGARIVVMGCGDEELEAGFCSAAQRYPKRVAVYIGHDEALAHKIVAASDVFLMPSRYEPCGQYQMHALRYGAVPIVAAVGGLADTIVDKGQQGIETGRTTGFAARRAAQVPLTLAIGKAMAVYPLGSLWRKLQQNGMRMDFSWDRTAEQYHALYAEMIAA